jgi:hypothetical protein
MTKGDNKVLFDTIIPTNKGMLFIMYFRRETEISGAVTDELPLRMTIIEAHQKLGHAGKDATRKMAKELGIELSMGQ